MTHPHTHDDKHPIRRRSGVPMCLSVSALLMGAPALASAACDLITDPAVYEERLQQAIVLMQYEDLVVRATGGKIRCEEDSGNARQVCLVEGEGEMLVVGGDMEPHVIRLTSNAVGEVHIYATGDVSCGLKSDFDSNR